MRDVTDEECREARRLYYDVGYTQTEIAEMFGVRVSNVMRLIHSPSDKNKEDLRIGREKRDRNREERLRRGRGREK